MSKHFKCNMMAGALLLLCVIANPLEQITPLLKWVDELLCLSTCLWGGVILYQSEELSRRRFQYFLYFIPFCIFMLMQLLGTVRYHYQPMSAVIIDAFTNAKFWLTLFGCYLISRRGGVQKKDFF